MKEIITRITGGGQITLPAEVRRILGVRPRDQVAFAIEDGEVRLVSVRYTLESAGGSVQPATSTKDLDELLEEAKEEMAERQVAKLRSR